MNESYIASVVMDEGNDIVYVADTTTYELYFLNHSTLKILGYPDRSEWYRHPCYKVLQGRSEPCEFCTNSLLTEENFYSWEHYNKMLDRYFAIKDKLIVMDGRQVRLEIAVDVTETELALVKLKQKLYMEETLVECVQTMRRNTDINRAINELLKIIGDYHVADRAYIFEVDYELNILINTYEWCKEGVTPQIDNLQRLPLEAADRWIVQFNLCGEFYINSLNENVSHDSDEYKILGSQGITSLMAAPLYQNDSLIGFMGVDNPQMNTDDMTLMRSVSAFIVDDLSKQALMDELRVLSYTDSLTGLGNRHRYTQDIETIESTPPNSIGIVFADINGLKDINDTYGHQRGDCLIKRVAYVLKDIFPDKIYRIGGDEFVVICDNMERAEFDGLIAKLRSTVKNDDKLQISIGSSWHRDAVNIRKHIEHTDDLMYLDKQKYYEQRLSGQGKYHANLARQLLRDIRDGKFEVFLQPQIELDTGRIRSAEALVRRRTAEGELENPAKFIPRYEEEGIIRHIDFFVVETVCATISKWKRDCVHAIRISVNFSRVTLQEDNIAGKLKDLCARYGVDADDIVIEITESVGDMDNEEMSKVMSSLTESGFSISLDDFGTGYSNLAVLSNQGFDEVKLDKSLIDSLECSDRSQIIAEWTIGMCRKLGFNVSVGEGIETTEQRDILQKYDCNVGQGYFFDRPMPIDKFEEKYMK